MTPVPPPVADAGLSGGEIAAIIAALAGLITAVFAGYRALRGDKVGEKASEAAAVLTGLQGLVGTLQEEIRRVNEARKQDNEECDKKIKEIEERYEKKVRELEERVDELGTQVYILKNRPPESRQRADDV